MGALPSQFKPEAESPRWQLLVCVNRRLSPGSASCAARGGERLAGQLPQMLADRGLPITVETLHCFGRCGKGPNMRLAPAGEFFSLVDEGDLPAIVERLAELVG